MTIIYLLIAAAYAAYGIKKGNAFYVALGLSALWPLFLCMGLLRRFRSNAASPLTTDACRELITQHILLLSKLASDKTREHGDAWSLLMVDAGISHAAIKHNPNDIPVIIYAFMNVIRSLGRLMQMPDKEQAQEFTQLQEALAAKTNAATARLIELHGHKLNEQDVARAMQLVDSYKWDGTRNAFVPT